MTGTPGGAIIGGGLCNAVRFSDVECKNEDDYEENYFITGIVIVFISINWADNEKGTDRRREEGDPE